MCSAVLLGTPPSGRILSAFLGPLLGSVPAEPHFLSSTLMGAYGGGGEDLIELSALDQAM